MGYTIHGGDFRVGDSDNSVGLMCEVEDVIVRQLKKHEKVKDNTFNTDGIVDVALVLQDCIKGVQMGILGAYANEFIARFEQYIKKAEKADWSDDKANARQHITAYRKLLKNIKARYEE